MRTRPERLHEPVADVRPTHHRDREGGEPGGGEAGRRPELVVEVDRRPVPARALHQQAGERQRAHGPQPPRRADEDRLGAAAGVGAVGQEPAGGGEHDREPGAAARGRCTRGSTPAAATSPPRTPPTRPPAEKPAWKLDRIGRPKRFSTVTPWAFIATSSAPIPMPKRNVSATNAPNDGASATQAVATAASTRPPRVAVRLPTRAASAARGRHRHDGARARRRPAPGRAGRRRGRAGRGSPGSGSPRRRRTSRWRGTRRTPPSGRRARGRRRAWGPPPHGSHRARPSALEPRQHLASRPARPRTPRRPCSPSSGSPSPSRPSGSGRRGRAGPRRTRSGPRAA